MLAQHLSLRFCILYPVSLPIRGETAAARLPWSIRAIVANPLVLPKIAARPEAEDGDSFLFVNKPPLDLAVGTTTGRRPSANTARDSTGLPHCLGSNEKSILLPRAGLLPVITTFGQRARSMCA